MAADKVQFNNHVAKTAKHFSHSIGGRAEQKDPISFKNYATSFLVNYPFSGVSPTYHCCQSSEAKETVQS